MKKENKNLIALNTKEILLYLLDANIALLDIFDRGRVYKKSIKSYWKWRDLDKANFSKKIYSLKRQKIINVFSEERGKFIELTDKGTEKLRKFVADDLKITFPSVWDKKWRVVIFDVPNKKRMARDEFRTRLKQIGFFAVQESVFVYPFDCKVEVDYFKNICAVKAYVLYMIVDVLESEVDIFGYFLDRGILKKDMI